MRPAGWHFLPSGGERPSRDSILAAAGMGQAALARELRAARAILGATRAAALLQAAEAEAGQRFGRPMPVLLATTQQPRSLADALTLGFAIAGFALTLQSVEGILAVRALLAEGADAPAGPREKPAADGDPAAGVRMALLSMPDGGAAPESAAALRDLAAKLAVRTMAPVGLARFRLPGIPGEDIAREGGDVVPLDIPVNAVFDQRFAATFGAILTSEAADRLADAAAGLAARLEGTAPKLVITDLDGTLWQGVLGEGDQTETGEGVPALRRAYAEALAGLGGRGLVLAVASRNDPADVETALRTAAPLGPDAFAARAVGWADKASLVADILDRLGLAPEHAVFIDDDPVNCAAVSARFPAMDVRLFAGDADAFAGSLLADPLLAGGPAGPERAAQYRRRAAVEHLRDTAADEAAFLRGLGTRVTLLPLDAPLRPRAAELASRVNQFLFTAYRPNGPQLAARPDGLDTMARLDDAFGAHGLVGLVLAHREGEEAVIDNLFLSCRALQRGVEGALLHGLARQAEAAGLRRIRAEIQHLPRNEPAREALALLGFVAANAVWIYDLGLAGGPLDGVPEGIDLILAPGAPT